MSKDKLIATYGVESHREDIIDQMNTDSTKEEVVNDTIPRDRLDEYYSLYDWYLQDEFEDMCEIIGQRIVALKGKVSILGSNLDWRGSNGTATFECASDSPIVVGREFIHKFASCYNNFAIKVFHIGNYDTGKSFDLLVSHHDADTLMYIRPQKHKW